MPVRPKGRPTSEGLSCNDEKAEGEDQDMAGDKVAQADGCVHPDANSQTEEGQEKSDSARRGREERGSSVGRKKFTEGPDQEAERGT